MLLLLHIRSRLCFAPHQFFHTTHAQRGGGITVFYGGREGHSRHVAATSGRCQADVAAMVLRRRSDVGPMSGRSRCDVAATSGRCRVDVAAMALRRRADVAAMALRRRSDVAVMALRRRCNGAPMYNMRMHINMSTGHALHGRRQDMMKEPGISSRRVTHRPDRMSLSTAQCTTSL